MMCSGILIEGVWEIFNNYHRVHHFTRILTVQGGDYSGDLGVANIGFYMKADQSLQD